MTPMKAGGEAAFQVQVLNLAGFHGWRAYHTHDSRRSQRGFPDLVLVRAPELIFAELKTATGRIRPEQRAWLDELRFVAAACAHVEAHVWRPAEIQEIADRLGRPRVAQPGELGICAHCESPDVEWLVPVTDRFRCRACGATWSGIRRLAA